MICTRCFIQTLTLCAGTPLEYGTPRINDIVASEGINISPGTRSIVLVDIHQVGTSCGFSMPCYDFVNFRPTLNEFFEKRVKAEREGKRADGIERLVFHSRRDLVICRLEVLTSEQVLGVQERMEYGWLTWHAEGIQDRGDGQREADEEDDRTICTH